MDNDRIECLRGLFVERFGCEPTAGAIAPGRVNLIGEHTDYSEGFVLPIAIDLAAVVLMAPGDGEVSVLHASDLGESVELPPGAIAPGSEAAPTGSWQAYVAGSMTVAREALGVAHGSVRGLLSSTVPAGGGLSSSAAIEVATITAVESLVGKRLDPVEKAKLAQRSEHAYAGVPCGIMDQYASSLGKRDHALLIDCRSFGAQLVAMPGSEELSVAVINTNVKHALTDGGYAARRRDVEASAAALGVPMLRDATPEMVEGAGDALSEVQHRRARHVVTENARVLEAVAALRGGDLEGLGRAVNASHDSLRDDFEVSCEELDFVVAFARGMEGVVGARMTGAGFGGCAIALGRSDVAARVIEAVAEPYRERFGRSCTGFLVRASEGARAIAV